MNTCSLCNPESLKLRDQAYKLLASGCTIASVARKLNIADYTLQKCWAEHDTDPVRNAGRRLVKARKRLARAETRHKKKPDGQSRLELDSSLRSVAELEQLAKQAATDAPVTVDSGGFTEQESSRFTAYIDSVVEKVAADRQASPDARMLGMYSMLNNRPDGSHIAELVWKLIHDPALLAACLKLSQEPKEMHHPRAPLGERWITN
jgi:hypothetical protein